MNERIEKAISSVKPADKEVMTAAKERQAELAKPPGSLGVLEELSIRVAGMTGKIHNKAEKCRIVVLCADNGVCDEGVSCTPQSVTLAQTINLTRGMTGASSLAKHFGDEIAHLLAEAAQHQRIGLIQHITQDVVRHRTIRLD